ncbi:MAG: rhamnogalacturonan acetylesterase [Lacunisphaera sp.]
MKNHLLALASACLALAAASAAMTDAAPPKPVRIVLVGDSTVTDFAGWGLGFKAFLTDRAEWRDAARSGRSSKSYRDEGHWAKALALQGDYYLIQFGHNDQPGKGPKLETDPDTTFTENMARYVDEVRAIGGKPILVTSLTRRNFDREHPDKIHSTLWPYVDAVKRLAAAKQVPLIDLHARSIELCERLGPAGCAALNPIDEKGAEDRTHLGPHGSVLFARLVVEDLHKVMPELAPCLRGRAGRGHSAGQCAAAARWYVPLKCASGKRLPLIRSDHSTPPARRGPSPAVRMR